MTRLIRTSSADARVLSGRSKTTMSPRAHVVQPVGDLVDQHAVVVAARAAVQRGLHRAGRDVVRHHHVGRSGIAASAASATTSSNRASPVSTECDLWVSAGRATPDAGRRLDLRCAIEERLAMHALRRRPGRDVARTSHRRIGRPAQLGRRGRANGPIGCTATGEAPGAPGAAACLGSTNGAGTSSRRRPKRRPRGSPSSVAGTTGATGPVRAEIGTDTVGMDVAVGTGDVGTAPGAAPPAGRGRPPRLPLGDVPGRPRPDRVRRVLG